MRVTTRRHRHARHRPTRQRQRQPLKRRLGGCLTLPTSQSDPHMSAASANRCLGSTSIPTHAVPSPAIRAAPADRPGWEAVPAPHPKGVPCPGHEPNGGGGHNGEHQAVEIPIAGFAFPPPSMPAGTNVRWRNNDPADHLGLRRLAPDIATLIPPGGQCSSDVADHRHLRLPLRGPPVHDRLDHDHLTRRRPRGTPPGTDLVITRGPVTVPWRSGDNDRRH
jgi:hypothetical protein